MSAYASINPYIKPYDRVLDCGCGEGELLRQLRLKKQVNGYGIDFKADNIATCIKKGLSVFHGDIIEGVAALPTQHMDVVIVSKTLQQVQEPVALLHDVCRVGKQVIVTFPNFSHWRCRFQLLGGRIPQSSSLPYAWYDTPNIRVISVRSFQEMCRKEGFVICDHIRIQRGQPKRGIGANFWAEEALFVIKKERL